MAQNSQKEIEFGKPDADETLLVRTISAASFFKYLFGTRIIPAADYTYR